MNTSVSVVLLAWSLLVPFLLVAVHVLLYRLGFGQQARSPQAFLAKLVVVCNLPVLAGAGIIGAVEGRGLPEAALMLIYAAVVFNGAAYAYFHVFNMSETARRIRMLLFLCEQNGATKDDLLEVYSPINMVTARLERLVEMRQIARDQEGHYHVTGRLLLWAANAVEVIRHLLGFDRVRD